MHPFDFFRMLALRSALSSVMRSAGRQPGGELTMLEGILFMGGLGAACSIVLGVAARIFYVYEDPRIAQVEGCFAGANCGGCGFAGCSAAAAAVVAGKTKTNVCLVGGLESAQKAAAVMGVEVSLAEAPKSINPCTGGLRAENKFVYLGINTCRAEAAIFGGKRVCGVGCIGHGDCVRVCLFDAIAMGPDGFPVVDEKKCVGCGMCAQACPKNLLKVRTPSERLLHFNQLSDCLAPCRQTCPAEIDIPTYIHQIRQGDYAGAVQTIRERNPLLLACGRVCPHPCEDNCRRGVADDPVSINQLKRFAADYEMTSGRHLPVSIAPETGKRIAVVGGGPAGLTCAYFLRRLGHQVTIFEAMPKLGGMLRYGIPEYRLPKQVLDWEIQGILDLGVETRTGVRFGADFDLESLLAEGYQAVFLGIGAWKDTKLAVPGEESGRVLHRDRLPLPPGGRRETPHPTRHGGGRRRQHGHRLHPQPDPSGRRQGLPGLPPHPQGDARQRGGGRGGRGGRRAADVPERPGAGHRQRSGSA